ncbi:hypothetical protein MMC27_006703 [Xylographa pallens]|nr:hypothetical protein [Xylographa pallens]
MHRGGSWADPDEELSNPLWDAIEYYAGTVALDHSYAAAKGLPRAQDFPWDNSKGIYFLNGHHGLHCVVSSSTLLTLPIPYHGVLPSVRFFPRPDRPQKRIRRTLLQLRDGLPLTSPLEHSLHCLNSLRQDVLCAADDTPLYSSFEHPGQVGFGQARKCRSWEQLEEWANAHTSCWRDINSGQHIDTLLRYRYCPEGSPYYERIHALFGDFEMGKNASAET